MKSGLFLACLLLCLFPLAASAWQEVRDLPFEERGDQAGLLVALDRQANYLLSPNPDATNGKPDHVRDIMATLQEVVG